MIKAEIKRLHSPDVWDLESHIPEIKDNFGFLVQMMVGVKDEEWEESFDMMICTPKWLQEEIKDKYYVSGRHTLIVEYYDYKRIFIILTEMVNSSTGTTWNEVATKIARIGYWEFEDYKEYEEPTD